MLHMFWQAALLVAVAWVATRAFRRSSASFRYAIWLLVFVKLVLPPSLATPWSAGNVASKLVDTPRSRAVLDELSALQPIELQEPARPLAELDVVSPETAVPQTGVVQATPVVSEHTVPDRKTPLGLMTLLMLGWAAVAVSLFAMLLLQYWRYSRKVLRHLSPASEPVRELFAKQVETMHVRRNVRLMVSPTVQTPALFGFRRPIILLPEGEEERLSQEELSNVLAHELAHIKRNDMPITLAAGLLSCVYWFNPAVWLANLYLRREREMACDDVVLRSTKREGKKYASTIVHVAESFTGGVPVAAGFLGLLELSDNLLHRIRSVGDTKRARRLGWGSALAILLVTATCVPMGRWSRGSAAQEHPNTATVDEEIELYYSKAHPEVQEFVRWTARTFGRPGTGLWLPENAFDALTREEREAKIAYNVQALEGEYGRHLCTAVVEAGVLKGERLLPGVLKVATYHREDANYDCRPKWMGVAALGRLGKEPAVPELIPLVDHGNKNVRMWARASLMRLTDQSFGADKQAWGNWWNSTGKTPKLDQAALKPWTPPAGVSPARKVLAFRELPPEEAADVGGPDLDKIPGKVVFEGTYNHRSRRRDAAPSTLVIRQQPDGAITAIGYFSSRPWTNIAVGTRDNRLVEYRSFERASKGEPRYGAVHEFQEGKVKSTKHYRDRELQVREIPVPAGSVFDPNTRPDTYCAANILLRRFAVKEGETKEFDVYDTDNDGQSMSAYRIKVAHTGKEEVTVPAGVFEANHIVLTQLTTGYTWFKKRAGHVTDFWVLDNDIIVRIHRHREPYELLLAEYTVPAALPGYKGPAPEEEVQSAAAALEPSSPPGSSMPKKVSDEKKEAEMLLEKPPSLYTAKQHYEAAAVSLLEKADSLYRAKEYSEAIPVYRQIHETYPEWSCASHALMMIGICYNRMGDKEEALKAFEYAVQEYPEMKGFSEATYYYLGESYLQTGQKDKALEVFEKCIELCLGVRDPNEFPYKNAMEKIEALGDRGRSALAVSRFGAEDPGGLRAACANNLKQMGLVFKMFANEHNGRWPTIDDRHGDLIVEDKDVFPEYLTDLNILRCPGNEAHAYIKKPTAEDVTDKSYYYLGWAVATEDEGLALLDAYERLYLSQHDEDIEVEEGKGWAGRTTLYRLREGVERFLITDINNPRAMAEIQSRIPVMWERPGHHEWDGGNVLFMDGHVVYYKYCQQFPFTSKFLQRLEQISARKGAN